MANFYSPKPQALFDEILWLPQEGARATGPAGRPPNAYAILGRDGTILVDAAFSWNRRGIDEVADMGKPILGLVLTCAHVAEASDALGEIANDYGCPVLVHPDDAAAARGAHPGVDLGDAAHQADFAREGVDVIPMPFHTPGAVMLFMEEHRGTLFSGASAIAPGPMQEPEPPRLERPRIEGDDAAFRKQWEVLCAQRKFSNVLPLYGTPYTDRTDMHQITRKLWDGSALAPDEAEPAEAHRRAEGVDV